MINAVLSYAGLFYAVLSYAGLFYATWLLFVLAMHFKARWAELGPFARVLALPPALAGLAFDALLQIVSSALFLDLPRELLMTGRLKRYHETRAGTWRDKIGRFICEKLLNPFDAGHC